MEPNCIFFWRQELWTISVEMQELTGALENNLLISSLYEWANQGAGNMAGGAQSWLISSGPILAVLEYAVLACKTSGVTFHLELCRVTHPATIWNQRILELPGSF